MANPNMYNRQVFGTDVLITLKGDHILFQITSEDFARSKALMEILKLRLENPDTMDFKMEPDNFTKEMTARPKQPMAPEDLEGLYQLACNVANELGQRVINPHTLQVARSVAEIAARQSRPNR